MVEPTAMHHTMQPGRCFSAAILAQLFVCSQLCRVFVGMSGTSVLQAATRALVPVLLALARSYSLTLEVNRDSLPEQVLRDSDRVCPAWLKERKTEDEFTVLV